MKSIIQLPVVAFAIGNIFPGECPTAPDQPNFDVDRYTGIWHTHLANDWQNIPDNAECVTATYGIIDDVTISVNNTATLTTDIAGRPLKIISWASGTATVLDAEIPTRLYVSLNEFGGCGEHAWWCGSVKPDDQTLDVIDGPYINYQVADTDYETYTVVIDCYGIPNTDTHSQITYIMTRDPEWPYTSEGKQKIQEILYNVNQWGFDIDLLTYTKQDNCQ